MLWSFGTGGMRWRMTLSDGIRNTTGGRRVMKEICKNCEHAQPTYKGVRCEVKDKKVKTTAACEEWRPKR